MELKAASVAVPNDWDLKRIDQFARIGTGSRNTQDQVEHGQFPFFVRSQEVERIDTYSFDCEAVLTAGDGQVGEVFHYINGKFDVHQRVYIVRQFSGMVDGKYFYYQFGNGFLQRSKSLTAKSSVDSVRMETIAGMEVLLPPLLVQSAIANVLSDVDALLEALDRLIAKKRDIKQAAMQQLLTGRTRLPGFKGEWEVKRLGEIAKIVMGQSPSSTHYNTRSEGIPLIQGNTDVSNRKAIPRVFTTESTRMARPNDVLMSVRAPVGEISRLTFDACLGRGVCAMRFQNNFLYHFLIFLEPTWAKHAKGSTFESVSAKDIKEVEIMLPSAASEQSAIAEVLSDMDSDIAELEARRDKTRDLKKAMMQELLTGRTRLVEPDESDA